MSAKFRSLETLEFELWILIELIIHSSISQVILTWDLLKPNLKFLPRVHRMFRQIQRQLHCPEHQEICHLTSVQSVRKKSTNVCVSKSAMVAVLHGGQGSIYIRTEPTPCLVLSDTWQVCWYPLPTRFQLWWLGQTFYSIPGLSFHRPIWPTSFVSGQWLILG